ncbi:hypothetical protein M3Y96_01146900 [Aphelenchoides besseyi]|nr:hypothetical protein M3Y96_01146900 [Aphelenchoides besseyi]
MQHNIWSPIAGNGRLFGFPVDNINRVNTRKLYEFSLVDGSKIEHEVEENIDKEIRMDLVPSVWTNDKLLVGVFDYSNEFSTVYKFDVLLKKWEKTKIEVNGPILSMTEADGILIVHALDDQIKTYRFQYEAVDSLSNLAWLSMQRHSTRYKACCFLCVSSIK